MHEARAKGIPERASWRMNPLRLLDGLGTSERQVVREGIRPSQFRLVAQYTAGLIVVALIGVLILVAYTPS